MATQPTQYKSYISGDPGSPYFTGGQFPNLPQGGGFREVSQQEAARLVQQHLALRKGKIGIDDYNREFQQFTEAFKPQSAYETYQNPFTGETLKNVSQETVNQLQQQQADLAAGRIKQIRPGMFVPTGSPGAQLAQQIAAGTAPQQPTGVQQTQTQQVQPPQGQVQIGTSPSGQPLYAPVGSPAALLQQQKQPPAGTQPPTTQPTQPQQEQQPQTYTVKSGDTLSQIAAQLGVNWKTDITGFKSGDPDLIFPGEVLTIKKAFTPTPSTDLPPPEPKDTGIGGADDTTPPPPEQTNPLTPGEEDYSKVLQQRSYDDYVDSFSKKLGLDDLKKQLGDLNLALEAAKQKGINRRNDINNNPWISEELRGRKIANADRASKEEESLALEQFNLAQKQYDNAREEIKFAAKMAVDQQNEDRDFYFKTKEAALEAQRDALKDAGIDTQVISAGNRQLLINSQTGETIKDLGTTTFKPTAGTTGVPPQEIEDLDTQIYGLMGQLSPQQLDELISLGLL